MLRTYVRITLRTLRNRLGTTTINVLGLGFGIAASLLIGLYARHELTYDRFHAKADRIYLVYKERITPTGTQRTEDTWAPLAEALQRDFPAVETAVRLLDAQGWVQHGDRRFEEQIMLADASLFDVFDVPLIQGDAATALDDVNAVVISQAMAEKYFGDTDPIGQTLLLDHTRPYTVTGVLAGLPSNSTLQIDLAVRWESLPDYDDFKDEWGGSFLYTFILLKPGTPPDALEAQFPAFITKIWDAETAGRTNIRLEPLPALHDARTNNRRYAYILLGIAGAILLIACINFTNLATARSMERAKEIGMRKVMGAGRRQLIGQFLGEAVLLSLLALALAVALTELLLPVFSDVYGLHLELGLLRYPERLVLLLGLGLVVGTLAGLYPALYLSGLQPMRTLQGTFRTGRSGVRLRQALIVTQFALSIALIAGTLLVREQITYMKTADLHFDRENLVAIDIESDDFADPEAAQHRLATFMDELRQEARVANVSASAHRPGDWAGWFTFARPEGWGDQDPLRLRVAFMDDAYFATYGIRVLAGRAFSPDRPADAEDAVILNEAAVREFGWSAEESIGRRVRQGDTDFTIVGVVEDYHYLSLQSEIAPVLHFYRPPENAVHNYLTVRLTPGNAQEALAMLERHWAQVDPARALPYTFVDDSYAALYRAEEQLAVSAGAFALLAVLIACLGLFGLASFMAQQRTKEIGVRKVLGASVPRLVLLFTRDFGVLVGLGFAVAVPLAYLGLSRWLATFPYRIEISATIFLMAGSLTLAVALLTVSYQAIRVALADPVEALRYE